MSRTSPGRNAATASASPVKTKRLGAAAGGKKLGCSLYEQPPGKRAFPYHCHFANEEAVYVLEGEGTLRIGAKEVPLRAGDYVALPVGEETAHQIINSSTATLRYLCFSTSIEPEVVKYPDSGKVGLMAGLPAHPGVPRHPAPRRARRLLGRRGLRARRTRHGRRRRPPRAHC